MRRREDASLRIPHADDEGIPRGKDDEAVPRERRAHELGAHGQARADVVERERRREGVKDSDAVGIVRGKDHLAVGRGRRAGKPSRRAADRQAQGHLTEGHHRWVEHTDAIRVVWREHDLAVASRRRTHILRGAGEIASDEDKGLAAHVPHANAGGAVRCKDHNGVLGYRRCTSKLFGRREDTLDREVAKHARLGRVDAHAARVVGRKDDLAVADGSRAVEPLRSADHAADVNGSERVGAGIPHSDGVDPVRRKHHVSIGRGRGACVFGSTRTDRIACAQPDMLGRRDAAVASQAVVVDGVVAGGDKGGEPERSKRRPRGRGRWRRRRRRRWRRGRRRWGR